MNRKQKIIVSVTGIFLVLLILVGLTYAYFLTQITGNTNEKSISVTTADLRLVYGDGTKELLTSSTKLIPSSNAINTKDFTVTNTGDDTHYAVIIENVIVKDATTEELTTFNSNDFVYTLSCTSNNGTCNGVSEQTVLPMSDNILVENDIAKDEVHTYEIVVYYLETNKDQSSDMNKTLEARINIEDPNRINPYSSNTNSLAYNVINNALNVTNDEINDGYAAYRSTPLTKPAEEITGKFVGIEPTEFTSVKLTATEGYSNYNNKYYVVGDDYIGTNKGFKLVNPRVVQYLDNYQQMRGKYVTWYSGYQTQEEAENNAIEGKTFINVYKVGDLSESLIFYYGKVGDTKDSMANLESSLSINVDNNTKLSGLSSYYFRGGVVNNYIEFNGMCWRIVRVEGDGSVKITLSKQGLCSTITGDDTGSAFVGNGSYGYDSNWYIDYENSVNRSTSMEFVFNEWFNENMKNVTRLVKSSYICKGDTITKYDSDGNITTSTNRWYFENYFKFNNLTPTLVCSELATSTKHYQIYPLTIDEIMFAGMNKDLPNYSSYLIQNTDENWWSLSPSNYRYMAGYHYIDNVEVHDEVEAYVVQPSGYIFDNSIYVRSKIRPAISLISGIELANDSGIGTQTNPYRVVES